jgi:hypothetical protein
MAVLWTLCGPIAAGGHDPLRVRRVRVELVVRRPVDHVRRAFLGLRPTHYESSWSPSPTCGLRLDALIRAARRSSPSRAGHRRRSSSCAPGCAPEELSTLPWHPHGIRRAERDYLPGADLAPLARTLRSRRWRGGRMVASWRLPLLTRRSSYLALGRVA